MKHQNGSKFLSTFCDNFRPFNALHCEGNLERVSLVKFLKLNQSPNKEWQDNKAFFDVVEPIWGREKCETIKSFEQSPNDLISLKAKNRC